MLVFSSDRAQNYHLSGAWERLGGQIRGGTRATTPEIKGPGLFARVSLVPRCKAGSYNIHSSVQIYGYLRDEGGKYPLAEACSLPLLILYG